MGVNFLKSVGKAFKSTGDWIKHAAEDTYKEGKNIVTGGFKTVGSAGKTLLNFTDNQVSKVTDVLKSPSFLLIAGGIVVVLIVMNNRR